MLINIIIIILIFLTISYLVVYTKETFKFAYKIKENIREEIAYEKLFYFKIISWTLYAVPFILVVIISPKDITLRLTLIYYTVWIIGLFLIKTNIKLVTHLLNVIFVRHELKKITKDFIIGGIREDNLNFYFFYRLLNREFKI